MAAEDESLLLHTGNIVLTAPVSSPISVPSSPSFHELLVAALPSLWRQAMALMGHRADAEDLMHAAITSALAAQNSFEPGTNFRAWMNCILKNRYFSNVRRRRPTVNLDDAPSSHLIRSGGQEENLTVQDLRRLLLRLPANQCEILLMIAVQGLSYEEASERLGIAVGTLKYRVFRARSQLQVWMLGETGGRGAALPAE